MNDIMLSIGTLCLIFLTICGYAAESTFKFPLGVPPVPGTQPKVPGVPGTPGEGEKWQRTPEPKETSKPDEGRGNWVYKQQFLKKARSLDEKIHQHVATIESLQGVYFKKRGASDKELEQFYQSLKFEQGELEELLTQLTKNLEKEREEQGQLPEPERELLATITTQKEEVEQLQRDAAHVRNIDTALDQAITVLLDQINAARRYEQKSWENYDKISQVLNDRIAEQLYLGIKGFLENVEAIERYLQGPLDQYVDQSIQALRNYMDKVTVQIKHLKQQGVMVEKHVVEEEAREAQARKQRELEEQQAAKAALEAQRKAAARTWWQRTRDWLSNLGNRLAALVSYPSNKST